MSDPGEHEDGGLTRSVRQFRRMARLLDLEPLQLSPDPLIGLTKLDAPLAALIDMVLFERLREALASPEPVPRGSAPRGRSQLPLPNATLQKSRPLMSVPGRTAASSRADSAAALRSAGSTVVPFRNEGGRQQPQRVPETATLAQRRAEVRRGGSQRGPASSSRSSPSGSAFAAATVAVASLPATEPRQALAAGPSGSRPIATVSHRPTPGETVTADPFGIGNTSTTGEGDPIRASDRRAATAFAAFNPAPVISEPGSAAPSGTQAAAPADVGPIMRPPDAMAAPPPLPSIRPTRAQAPAAAMSPRRSWQRNIDLEQADDLFEALYRNGVDLSWP